jgi:hypothetical protein
MPAPKETSSLHPSIWLNGEESHLFFATNLEVYSMCRKFALSLSSHKKEEEEFVFFLTSLNSKQAQ